MSDTVERFQLDRHYKMLCDWLSAYGIKAPPIGSLPKVGVIVNGAACGFLYRTDSSIAFMDGICCKKSVSGDLRRRSIDLVIDELKRIAPKYGVEMIIGFSKIRSMCERAVADDWIKESSYSVFYKKV